MGRWLAATLVLAGMLAAGAVAFFNRGDPLPIHLTPGRSIALPLGTALVLAFATGAVFVALLALGSAVARAWRSARHHRSEGRRLARLRRERLHAETLLVGGEAGAARARLADAVTAHGGDERLLELMAGAAEQSGDMQGAIAALEDARAKRPESPLLARRLSLLYAAAQRWDDALALEEEVAGSARTPRAATAEAERIAGLRFEAAVADPDQAQGLRRLLALGREHPGFTPAWVVAGDRLQGARRTFRARRVYERGLRQRPATVLVERLAALDTGEGRPARTLRTLRALGHGRAIDAELLSALVRQHLLHDALDEAEAALASWSEGAPATAALEAMRGECCRRRGQSEQATLHFGRAAAAYLAAPVLRCRACGVPAAAWEPRCAGCGRWDAIAATSELQGADLSANLIPTPSRSTLDTIA